MSHLRGLSHTSSYLYWKKSILQYWRNWWVRKMDKVENLEYTCPLFHKILILSGYHFCPLIKASNSAENWQKMSCDNPKLGIVNNNMYAKYDPNPSILSQDIERNPTLGINQVPLTLLKWIWDLCANNMHIFRPWPNHLRSFKAIGLKLQEELRSRNTHWL